MRLTFFLAMSIALALAGGTVAEKEAPTDAGWRVLVFSKTKGFRHKSIEPGIAAIRTLGETQGFEVDATEDASAFTADNLARYDAVIFLNTSGNVLDETQQEAFQGYISSGGGFVGIHSATDTEYDWPWYGRLVGAYFAGHPKIQTATCVVEDHDHPATQSLPSNWQRKDEWYNFRDVQEGLTVLITVDESTYKGGKMGEHHPIAWCHEIDGGRSFYTGGGHTRESFAEPDFLSHILGGIVWAAGRDDTPSTQPRSE